MSIDIKIVNALDTGRWVIYTDGVGDQQEGILKSYGTDSIFVVFQCDWQWKRYADFTGNSCNPNDLNWKFPDEGYMMPRASDAYTERVHRGDCPHCDYHRTVYYNEDSGIVVCHHCGYTDF